MKFEELLIAAIQQSEIPLRFEPGAEIAVAEPVIRVLRAWISAHLPESPDTEFVAGYQALAVRLLAELEGSEDLPE